MGGTVLWDDDYRALRARLEVPSLGFGSLRTPGQAGGVGAALGGRKGGGEDRTNAAQFVFCSRLMGAIVFLVRWKTYDWCESCIRL